MDPFVRTGNVLLLCKIIRIIGTEARALKRATALAYVSVPYKPTEAANSSPSPYISVDK